MEYLQFNFEIGDNEERSILIARLSDAGFNGFEEEDTTLSAYISELKFDQSVFDEIVEQMNVKYSLSTIKETNWNAEWEANFQPVTVLDPVTALPFASIRANFHEPETKLIHELIITPKMSFGTGHHATTYLMVERMSQLDFDNKYVIDYGTGTGVLAILAEKMGAREVLAIDNDDWSIENTKENLLANGCEKVTVRKAETIEKEEKADIILANINLNIIMANLDAITAAAAEGATILFSGIMVKDKAEILQALSENFIEVINCFEKQHWLCIETSYRPS